MSEIPDVYLGIDLGGSNIHACAFDEGGTVVAENKIETEATNGYSHVIARISAQLQRIQRKLKDGGFRLAAAGLCVPGVVLGEEGRVKIAPNLGWQNVHPLRDLASGDLPVILINDVNAGLVGELSRYPDEERPRNALAYFCGTGVGGAVVVDGRLITGARGGAGEVGHMVVRLGGRKMEHGVRGSLEAYIGKWALNRRILERIESGKKTMLREIIKYNLRKSPVKSSSLKKAYEAGDRFCVDLMQEHYCKYLGAGIAQSANLLDPEVVILGGGIMEAMGEKLMPVIRKYLKRHTIGYPPELRLAELGDLAGAAGAAHLARLPDAHRVVRQSNIEKEK
ncbi:MAG: ROK family protein [bacterium]|nr:ROK family protein [bacterium]